MPKGKKIYEDLSKKYSERREARRKREADKLKAAKGPTTPPSVNNFKVNNPQFAKSRNFPAVPEKRRNISKQEGQPVVNASADVKKFIHKPKTIIKSPLDNPTAGVIKEEAPVKKTRGRPPKSKKTRKKTKNAKTNKR